MVAILVAEQAETIQVVKILKLMVLNGLSMKQIKLMFSLQRLMERV